MSVFLELTAIVLIASAVSAVMRFLKQPLIIGYISAGILSGPYFFNILQSKDNIELFSKIGITVLLFIVGLNLSPNIIKEIGKPSLILGIGQILITAYFLFFISRVLNFDTLTALYIAIALTLSSTIIVLKLLSDLMDVQKLYGKISIGILIMQDIFVSILLLFITTSSGIGDIGLLTYLSGFVLKTLLILIVLYLVSAYLLPKVTKYMASSSELLFLFSISWGLGLASAFYLSGFSLEIGALCAGVTLSMTPYALEIASRLKPLRDFFLVLFFVLLGSQTKIDHLEILFLPIFVLTVFVLFYKPVIVFILVNLLGFKRKTGFLTGLSISQISEFSLILMSVAFVRGQVSQDAFTIVTIVGVLSIIFSTYAILHGDSLYDLLEKYLPFLEIRSNKKSENSHKASHELLLFGIDNIGKHFIYAFGKLNKSYLVVDFNPTAVGDLITMNIPHRFGDAEDVEFLTELIQAPVKMAVSIIKDFKTNLLLVRQIKKTHPKAITIVLSDNTDHAAKLYNEGATYVIMPHYLGAKYASNMITRLGLDHAAFKEEREKHLEHLNKNINEDRYHH